jgi:hypothetical protein
MLPVTMSTTPGLLTAIPQPPPVAVMLPMVVSRVVVVAVADEALVTERPVAAFV